MIRSKESCQWMRVSRKTPCPVCEHTDWCCVAPGVVNCMRVKSDKELKNGGWLHRIDGQHVEYKPVTRQPKKSDTLLSTQFGPLSRSCYVKQSAKIKELAKLLGVAGWSLDSLHVGWDGAAWTFPEQNHRGQITGIKRRLLDGGKKLCVIGSRPSLTYVDGWSDYPGPVFLVEGGSDVAAGLTLGLCTVGRPSATGGVEYLSKLLVDVAGKRRIIVLAENDERSEEERAKLATAKVPHDPNCRCCQRCWPGKYGAISLAMKLSHKLSVIVGRTFLPDGAKDLRSWLNSQGADPENEQAMLRIGRSLSRRLTEKGFWR